MIFLLRLLPFALIGMIWYWAAKTPFSSEMDLAWIAGGIFLVYPTVWLGRKALDAQPTIQHATWVTTLVHFVLMLLLGAAIIRAVISHQSWMGWALPIPASIGLLLVRITGIFTTLTVVNLAWRGLGAPFAVALSKKLAIDWMYAWTRNPMVLGTLLFLTALGIWFQSALFVLWSLLWVTPAWLWFVKVYEERELEIRFGERYLEYKARTPMLLPRKPRE